MKTIGLLGGLTWHSTLDYYRYINEDVGRRLGPLSSAKINMCSINFHELISVEQSKKTEIIKAAAKSLENAGSDFIVICANTPHLDAKTIRAHVKLPLLHIVDVVREEIQRRNFKRVGLLATKMTVEAGFYQTMLAENKIELVNASSSEINRVDEIIQNELAAGRVEEKSKAEIKSIINRMKDAGLDGVILGCTEIPPIVNEEVMRFPCLDSTRLHANAAVNLALGGSGS